MKSVNLIVIFIYLLTYNTYSLNKSDIATNENVSIERTVDSLFDNQNLAISKPDAFQVILENEKNKKGKELIDVKNSYKNLAVSYAKVGNETKANEFITKYIQVSYDVNILNLSVFDNIRNSSGFKAIKKKYVPEINIGLIFFFATGLIGVFIAIVLNLRKQGDTTANMLISTFVMLHSLFIIHLSLFFSKLNFSIPHSLYASTSFSFLYGPLIYFYFKRITHKYVFKRKDVLHFLPTIVLIIFFLPIYIKSADEKLHLLYNRDNVLHHILTSIVILKVISLTIYGYLILKIYNKNKLNNQYSEVKKWKRNILFLNSAYVVSYIIYGIALISIVMTEVLIYPQILFMSIIVLYVGYVAYVQPRVFSKKYLFDKIILKYQKSGLTKKYSNELKQQLLLLLGKEKVYKINDLSLSSLAEIVGTSRHNLSQVINEHFNMNFFNLINKYRIEEAQEILMNDENRDLNIIDIAYDVGFNNKVTFNKAFKEITDLTPSQFLRKQTSNELSISLDR